MMIQVRESAEAETSYKQKLQSTMKSKDKQDQ